MFFVFDRKFCVLIHAPISDTPFLGITRPLRWVTELVEVTELSFISMGHFDGSLSLSK